VRATQPGRQEQPPASPQPPPPFRSPLAHAPGRPDPPGIAARGATPPFQPGRHGGTPSHPTPKPRRPEPAPRHFHPHASEALVFQCYLRDCPLTADDLAHAHEEGKDDVARIAAFVRRALSPERPEAAVVSEIAYLSDAKRTVVETEHGRNIAALESFVRN